MRDVLRGQTKRDDTVDGKIAGTIASYTAYFGLAFNLTSAFKQPSGAPAFMLKVPVMDYFAGIGELLSSGEIWATVREVWSSPLLKDRRESGEINQILSDFNRAEREMKNEPNAKKVLRRVFKKYAFAPVKFMDTVGFVLGGTSVYYHFLQQYKTLYPLEQAKTLAMADMVNVGELTQQSSLIMNMSEGQRRNGGIGKMFSTFRTTNQQYLSFELDAFAEVVANPNGKSFAKLAKVLILNHAILPTLFNGLGFLANSLLGDDFDKEDVEYMLKNTAICAFLDVFTGWWVTSIFKGLAQMYFLGGYNKLTDTLLPASSVARLGETLLYAGKDVIENGMDADWWKHIDRLGKATLAPYRFVKKGYDNYFAN